MCASTISVTLVQHDDLLHYNHCIFFPLVSIRNQIVTGFNLYPDATCRVRRQHRPISSNHTITPITQSHPKHPR